VETVYQYPSHADVKPSPSVDGIAVISVLKWAEGCSEKGRFCRHSRRFSPHTPEARTAQQCPTLGNVRAGPWSSPWGSGYHGGSVRISVSVVRVIRQCLVVRSVILFCNLFAVDSLRRVDQIGGHRGILLIARCHEAQLRATKGCGIGSSLSGSVAETMTSAAALQVPGACALSDRARACGAVVSVERCSGSRCVTRPSLSVARWWAAGLALAVVLCAQVRRSFDRARVAECCQSASSHL
jgi:hypothetical protein